MPTRGETIDKAIELFRNATYPDGLSAETAWLGIYQTVLWYEPVDWVGFDQLPHIIDANNLRPASEAKKSSWTKPNIWQERAQAFSEYLADQLRCSVEDLPGRVDLLMRDSDFVGMQRQNSLGIAFPGLVRHVLESFGPATETYIYEIEVPASRFFPTISIPGRSTVPDIDLLATRDGNLRAIISAKWSLRHDRINDITNECPAYKYAYSMIHRQVGDLFYYVITNEYNPSRLDRLLNDPCIDGVVHVHKRADVEVCDLDGRLDSLLDLRDLIEVASLW